VLLLNKCQNILMEFIFTIFIHVLGLLLLLLLLLWMMTVIIIISFMQGIYTYIPETNYIPSEYIVAAIMLLFFMALISLVSVLNLLYLYISTFRSMCAVPNMVVYYYYYYALFLLLFLRESMNG